MKYCLLMGMAFWMGLSLASAAETTEPTELQLKNWARMREKNWPKGLTLPDVEAKDKIGFILYTVSDKTLKLTAHLYPLAPGESRDIRLETKVNGKWKLVAKSRVRENDYKGADDSKAWNALFRVEDWDASRDVEIRVVALDGVAEYEGLIRKDPLNKNEVVVAAFTGNSSKNRRPREDIIDNVLAHDADLLFFSGDQVYDHFYHYPSWMLFGRQFGELTRQAPTICLPDDHDVGQGNIWGSNGKVSNSRAGNDGGFFMPVEFVNEVYFAQTAHMPDPYDSTPIERGIAVCYGSFKIGGIDFAIIEDRKFKSGPGEFINKSNRTWHGRIDHIGDAQIDPATVDFPDAKLLGDRQLKFLNAWSKDWRGAEMKCVLSQTVLAGAAHYHGHEGKFVVADMDSNGWPQTGRNKALKEIRRGYAFMLCGDQHLATAIHHGIDEFEDSGWSFCVPSIINFYGRWWHPQTDPVVPLDRPDPLPMAGSYFDGFKNRVTMYAYANPGMGKGLTAHRSIRRSAGHGIVRFNKAERTITMECWPRGSDVLDPAAKQYPGWPITITQEDNYGRDAVAHLPTLKVDGMENPVVQVINDSTGETVYTLRINGDTFTPKVFSKGSHTVVIGDQMGRTKKLLKVTPGTGTETIEF